MLRVQSSNSNSDSSIIMNNILIVRSTWLHGLHLVDRLVLRDELGFSPSPTGSPTCFRMIGDRRGGVPSWKLELGVRRVLPSVLAGTEGEDGLNLEVLNDGELGIAGEALGE